MAKPLPITVNVESSGLEVKVDATSATSFRDLKDMLKDYCPVESMALLFNGYRVDELPTLADAHISPEASILLTEHGERSPAKSARISAVGKSAPSVRPAVIAVGSGGHGGSRGSDEGADEVLTTSNLKRILESVVDRKFDQKLDPINDSLRDYGQRLAVVTSEVHALSVSTDDRLRDVDARFELHEQRWTQAQGDIQTAIDRAALAADAVASHARAMPPMSPRVASSAPSVASPESDFVPSKVELHGWSKFGESDKFLSAARASALYEEVLAKLPEGIKSLVKKPPFKFRAYWCVEFLVEPKGLDTCVKVCDAVRCALEATPIDVHDRAVLCRIERSSSVKLRRAWIAAARDALDAQLAQDDVKPNLPD